MGDGRARALVRLIVGLGVALWAGVAPACIPDQIELRGADGPLTYSVEIADTDEERAQGLMWREEMPRDHGMLFVYPSGREVAFWMKNTPLPLDIIYINERGVICGIARDTTPFSTQSIPSGCAAQTVLEVNAGEIDARGLKIGSPVRHPAILRPVWACE